MHYPGITMRTTSLAVSLAGAALLAGCAVSTQQEVQMGQQEAQQISTQLPMLQDAQVNAYVNDLGMSGLGNGVRHQQIARLDQHRRFRR